MPLPFIIALSILGPIWLALRFWFCWLWTRGNWHENKSNKQSTSSLLVRGFDSCDSSIGLAANSDEQLEYRTIKHNVGGIDAA